MRYGKTSILVAGAFLLVLFSGCQTGVSIYTRDPVVFDVKVDGKGDKILDVPLARSAVRGFLLRKLSRLCWKTVLI